MIGKNSEKYFFTAIIILAVYVIYTRYYLYLALPFELAYFSNFRGNEIRCIDYLAEGVLYQGQVFCGHPPILYLYGYLILKIFGWALFWHITYIMTVLMNTLLFYLVWKTIKKEVGDIGILFPALIYLIWIYFPSIGNTHMLLSTVFLYSGIYLLFESKHMKREWMAGILFSLSILTLIPSTIAVGIILAYYAIKKGAVTFKKNTHPTVNKDGLKSLLKIINPLLIVPIVFLFAFPNFAVYALRFTSEGHSLWETITLMSPVGANGVKLMYVILYVAVISSMWTFKKKKCVYSASSFIGLLALMFLMLKNSHIERPNFYYFMPFFPMLIVSLMKLWKMTKPRSLGKIVATTILIFLIISPGLLRLDLYIRAHTLRELIDRPMSFIPKQEGEILVEGDMIKIYQENKDVTPLDYNLIEDVLRDKEDEGLHKYLTSQFDYEGVTDFKDVFYQSTKREAMYEKKLKDGAYSLIVFGPPYWWTILGLYYNVWEEIPFRYYDVYMPNKNFLSHGGGQQTTLLFKDESHARFMRDKIREHYYSSFDEICRLDEFTAEKTVKDTLKIFNITLNKTCVGGGDSIREYQSENRMVQIRDVIVVLLIFFIVCLSNIRLKIT